jgi:GMP synthase (glutamine-hydrolysing)
MGVRFAGVGQMKRVVFVQHGEVDKPGLLGDVLAENGLFLEVAHPYVERRLNIQVDEFDGFVFGGGGQSVWDVERYPYLEDECRVIRQAVQVAKPVLGLCLGGQLIARASGGDVRRAEKKEIGFYSVTLTENAATDPLANLFPKCFGAAHWHGDIFELPAGAVHLASSVMTPNQMFRIGRNVYGFQFHPEMTAALFEELVRDEEEWFHGEGLDAEALIRDAGNVLPRLEASAREFFKAWAALV